MLCCQARSAASRALRAAARSPGTRAFHSLPVVDVSPLTQHGAPKDAKMEVAAQLDDACRRVGFFYVVNHGVREEVLRGVRDQAREWFALPTDVKNQIMLSRATNYRGFQELGANVTRYEGGFQRDWHEAIDLYKEADPAGEPRDLRGRNPWPDQVAGFRPALDDYVSEMTRLGEGIMRGVALGLGLPEHFFGGERAGDPYWCIRVIHYPPLPASPERATGDEGGARGLGEISRQTQLSCGEHTDYGLLTMVNQDEGVSALEVKNAQGQWVSADPIPGALVCNLGDMLKVWTNGRYTPTSHRVVHRGGAGGGGGRVSVPFFYEPCYDAVVSPLPELMAAGEEPRFPAVRYGDHLISKVYNNFEIDR